MKRDNIIFNLIEKEFQRQQNHIELIASENIVSKQVLEAAGSVLTNKYAEGYPKKRYYGGCEIVDEVEIIAQERGKKLFNCEYINVQPHSGSQANQAVFLAFLKPGDTILAMSLDCGGHLTHGAKKNLSGLWFNFIHYGVDKKTLMIDYNEVEKLALEHKPKMIIAGFSAYSRIIDWQKFREIANKINAILFVDMAHIAGLVATELYPTPIPFADVVTTTTHKTLRGPRGAIILAKDKKYEKELNSAVFPGLQGGPLMHIIAAKAIAFGEALEPEFKIYQQNVLNNSQILAKSLIENNIDVLTNGTDNHIVLVDLRKYHVTGKTVEHELNKLGLVCNKNAIPFDPLPPVKTSGIRLGSPAGTTRGFGEKEFYLIGQLISEVILHLHNNNNEFLLENISNKIKSQVNKMCQTFPIYKR